MALMWGGDIPSAPCPQSMLQGVLSLTLVPNIPANPEPEYVEASKGEKT